MYIADFSFRRSLSACLPLLCPGSQWIHWEPRDTTNDPQEKQHVAPQFVIAQFHISYAHLSGRPYYGDP